MINHLLNVILGIVMILGGWCIVETGTYGKYEQFPVPPFAGWLVVGLGIVFLVYGLWWILRLRRINAKHNDHK